MRQITLTACGRKSEDILPHAETINAEFSLRNLWRGRIAG